MPAELSTKKVFISSGQIKLSYCVDFPPFCTRKTAFMTSCLPPYTLKRTHLQKRDKTFLRELTPLKVYPVPLLLQTNEI